MEGKSILKSTRMALSKINDEFFLYDRMTRAIDEPVSKKRKLKLLTIGSKGNTFKILSHKIFENYQFLELKYKNKKLNKKHIRDCQKIKKKMKNLI